MCGIVGMAGNISSKEYKMFKDMLIFDSRRGIDSTGVLAMTGGKEPVYHLEKELGMPSNLWPDSNLFNKKGLVSGNMRFLLGHNRAATVGAITKETAHPFEFENVIGVHNGTLYSTYALEGDRDYPVDSQVLYNHISEKGIESAWKTMSGAAALAYWDRKDDTLCFVRNSQRPLFFGKSEDEDALFWASEVWMIQVAAMLNKVELKKRDKDDKTPLITALTENTLRRYEVTDKNFSLKEKKTLEVKTYPSYNYSNNYGVGFKGYGHQNTSFEERRAAAAKREERRYKSTTNIGWSNNTNKGGKETKGLEFNIISYGKKPKTDITTKREFFRCKFLDSEITVPLEIISMSLGDANRLTPSISSKKVFTTKTRVREVLDDSGKVILYKISSENIEPAKTTKVLPESTNVVQMPSVIKMGDKRGFNIYQKEDVTRKEWSEAMFHANWCCTCCGNPMDVHDAPSMKWFARNSTICATCQEDKVIMDSLYGIGV